VHCRDHALQLQRATKEIGAPLTLIGQATPRHAQHFRRKLGLDLPVLADERRASYRAAGAKVGTVDELVGPASVLKGIRAVARTGQLQGRTIGHPGQLGGTLVVAPDGAVVWSHLSANAGDNATPQEIAAAIRSLGS
jgi:hypothetical protein